LTEVCCFRAGRWTALTFAASSGHSGVLEVLIAAGTDVEARSNNG
jgi:hypothetical protein